MVLTKGNVKLKFDRTYETKNGRLLGINLLPRSRPTKGEVAMSTRDDHNEEDKPTKTWNINRMHQVFNHAGEEALRKTAKAYNWHVTGKMEPCVECQKSNIKQKGVSKYTDTKSTKPGERIFIDTTSIKHETLGGSKYMIGIVDDCTSLMWGNMLKRKKDQVPTMVNFLRRMKARGTPIKYIRCDNAGENKELQKKCLQTQDLCGIQFEFTSRDSPQFNGKIERKLQ